MLSIQDVYSKIKYNVMIQSEVRLSEKKPTHYTNHNDFATLSAEAAIIHLELKSMCDSVGDVCSFSIKASINTLYSTLIFKFSGRGDRLLFFISVKVSMPPLVFCCFHVLFCSLHMYGSLMVNCALYSIKWP